MALSPKALVSWGLLAEPAGAKPGSSRRWKLWWRPPSLWLWNCRPLKSPWS